MKLNSKVTWGLAWVGLAVVLAVPSADFLTGKIGSGNAAAVITSTTEPVQPVKSASVTTKVTPNGVIITPAGAKAPGADPVDKLLNTGKKLPDYISGGDTAAVVKAPAATSEPTQVATIDAVAPVPFPRPRDIDAPTLPKPFTSPAEPAVIVDDTVTGSIDPIVVEPTHPVPPAPIVDDSANWKKLGLTRYLDRNGLMSDKSTASVTVTDRPSSTYDPDGFYLNDGPNGDRAQRRARVEQLLNEDDSGGFNLF